MLAPVRLFSPHSLHFFVRLCHRKVLNIRACFFLLGQDNPSNLCIVGDVPNILEGKLSDHGGPYAGITMGC